MANSFKTRKEAFSTAADRAEQTGEQQFIQRNDGRWEVHGWVLYKAYPFYGPVRKGNADFYRHYFDDPRLNVGGRSYADWHEDKFGYRPGARPIGATDKGDREPILPAWIGAPITDPRSIV